FKWNLNAPFSTMRRYWLSELPFCRIRRLPAQSMGLIQDAMVMPAVMFNEPALATVIDCWLVSTKERADVPMRPGATQAGLLTSVPLLLFPEESAAVVPPFSSKCQFPTRPFRTSPE